MSIEANTYEELILKNSNEKTAAFAKAIGKYLQENWGIISLTVDVDGTHYETAEDIAKDSELYVACGRFETAKDLTFSMRSCNGGGLNWRQESAFLNLIDEDLKDYLTYRSIDYYDCDSGVDMYLYDASGSQTPTIDFAASAPEKVSKWYAYTPEISFCAEEAEENDELHRALLETFVSLAGYCSEANDEESKEEFVNDDWEDCGEMILDCSLSFGAEDVDSIVNLLQKLADQAAEMDDAEFCMDISCVADGEDDYNFAAMTFELQDGKVRAGYASF